MSSLDPPEVTGETPGDATDATDRASSALHNGPEPQVLDAASPVIAILDQTSTPTAGAEIAPEVMEQREAIRRLAARLARNVGAPQDLRTAAGLYRKIGAHQDLLHVADVIYEQLGLGRAFTASEVATYYAYAGREGQLRLKQIIAANLKELHEWPAIDLAASLPEFLYAARDIAGLTELANHLLYLAWTDRFDVDGDDAESPFLGPAIRACVLTGNNDLLIARADSALKSGIARRDSTRELGIAFNDSTLKSGDVYTALRMYEGIKGPLPAASTHLLMKLVDGEFDASDADTDVIIRALALADQRTRLLEFGARKEKTGEPAAALKAYSVAHSVQRLVSLSERLSRGTSREQLISSQAYDAAMSLALDELQ